MLEVRGVTTFYGAIQALHGVDLDVGQGEIVTLIGANGAGKSTLLMTICGNPRARSGSVKLEGDDITQLPTHEIVQRGVAQVPEGRRIFPRMSVLENLQMGSSLDGFAHFDQDLERVFTLFPRLKERAMQRGGTLSGGEQQMLAIARALMAKPRILLLDEPSLGLAPAMIDELYDALAELRDDGVTILLVDQMASLALTVADRGYVLESGHVVRADAAAALARDPSLEAAYLGGAEAAQ